MSAVFITHQDGTTEAAEFIPAAVCENTLRRKIAAIRNAASRERHLDDARRRNAERMRRSRAQKREVAS